MFNNELISDVKFVLKVTNCNEGKRQLAIPAHKYVLATSSPVFFAMFYGGFESKNRIELQNCDSESCLQFLRYLYCDEIHLTQENVMVILNLAKKYIVPSLEDRCIEFVEQNISLNNVFDVLSFAHQTFNAERLENLCWEIIDSDSNAKCLNTEAFLDTNRNLLNSVALRNSLSMREILLYLGIERWAARAARNRGLGTSASARRSVLGDSVLQHIRFPLMTKEELNSVVVPSGLLNKDEINAIFAYLETGITENFKYFPTYPRVGTINRINRFARSSFGFSYEGYRPDVVKFSVSEPIFLDGVRLFGSKGKKYSVSLQISCESSGFQLELLNTRSFKTETEMKLDYFGFDIIFDRPFALDSNLEYCVTLNIKGDPSFYGCYGRTRIKGPDDVEFKFNYGPYPLHTGQFAEIFYHQA